MLAAEICKQIMKKDLEPQLKTKSAGGFYKVLAGLEKTEEIANFLRDVLTIEELEEAIRRFEVAKLLVEGKTFRQICAETKMSSTTIARINYWLHHGTGGYRSALSKLN